jgi:predicted ArsR family transcriptional regulator
MSRSNGRSRDVNSDRRLLGTTKGRILVLLCRGRRTVSELASSVDLTANAVRAQLQRLQRDGLVQQAGSRRGVRKPHADYEITPKARQLFPTAYEPVLQAVLDVVDKHLPQRVTRKLLADVLRHLTQRHLGKIEARDPRQRFAEIMNRIEALSPGVGLEKQSSTTVIRACSCPLASVTASHPEICRVVATSLTGLLRTQVVENCDRGEWPQCCFEISF